jgi:hypothetical protein
LLGSALLSEVAASKVGYTMADVAAYLRVRTTGSFVLERIEVLWWRQMAKYPPCVRGKGRVLGLPRNLQKSQFDPGALNVQQMTMTIVRAMLGVRR